MPQELPGVVPIWSLIPFTMIVLWATVEAGYQIGLRARRNPKHESQGLASDLATPAVGMTGLMLAFTFGWVATRFDARRNARFDEARDIASVYRLAVFLSPTDRDQTRALLRQYIEMSLNMHGDVELQSALAQRESLHKELWAITARAGQADPNSQILAEFATAMNDLINDHGRRTVIAGSSRIPLTIVAGLFAILMLTTLMLGYEMGITSKSRSLVLAPMLLALAIVVFVIAELDRPLEGGIIIQDRGLQEVQRELPNWP